MDELSDPKSESGLEEEVLDLRERIMESILGDGPDKYKISSELIGKVHEMFIANPAERRLRDFNTFAEGLSPRNSIILGSLIHHYNNNLIPNAFSKSDQIGYLQFSDQEIRSAIDPKFKLMPDHINRVVEIVSALRFNEPIAKRLKQTLEALPDSIQADLYHTTTGRSFAGILEAGGLLYSGDQLIARGKVPLSGEGINYLDSDGQPIFRNPGQISFSYYVERRFSIVNWFRPIDRLLSFGVNDEIQRNSFRGSANGSLGTQRSAPYNLKGNLHSVVCDISLIEDANNFLAAIGEPAIVVISSQELDIIKFLDDQLARYLHKTQVQKFLHKLSNNL